MLLPLIHQNINKKKILVGPIQNPYLRTCVPGHSARQMQITKDMMTSNNPTSGRVSHSGPMMKNRNHSRFTYMKDNAAAPSSRANLAGQSGGSRVDTTGSSDQTIMDQQRRNLRAFNRADTMDNSKRQIKIPNDPSWVSYSHRFFSSFTFADKKLSFTSLSVCVVFTYSMMLGITKCTCRVHCWLNQEKWIRCWKNTIGSSRNSPDRKQNIPEADSIMCLNDFCLFCPEWTKTENKFESCCIKEESAEFFLKKKKIVIEI